MELIRKTYEEFGGKKWKYLKFLTVTWPIELSDNPLPPVEKMKSVWVKARTTLIEKFGAIGGTDVCEVVTKEVDGQWSHNVHFHSIWLSPYLPLASLQKGMKEAGIGRHEYTILKEQEYTTDEGEDRTQPAHRHAIEYLTKYLTKSTACKRMVWGDLRKWKEYLDEGVCRRCIKTTNDLAKDYPCQCETDVGASKERSEDF